MERKHIHICETGLALLAKANLPLNVWEDVFLKAVYLINRLPSPTLHNSTPLQLLFGKIPDYSFLKVFGCSCFPHLRPYNSHKLEFRSLECIFIGYSPSHKGYKCLAPNGKIYISKDVVFNEFHFPYHNKFLQNSSVSSLISTSPPILYSHLFYSSFAPFSNFNSCPNEVCGEVLDRNAGGITTGSGEDRNTNY